MNYVVNNIAIHYEAEGEKMLGQNVVLLEQAIDLTANTAWGKEGFTTEPLFTDDVHKTFITNTSKLLVSLWKKAGLSIPDNFILDQYHNIAATQDIHLAAVEFTKLLPTTSFPIPVDRLEKRISEICHHDLLAHNPFDNQRIFHFRVVRPQRHDNNPLHRDVWLEDYKDCINLYIPITGSNENSSLVIIPESHHWPDAKIERTPGGAQINGTKFNVPAVTQINGTSRYVRPNPGINEVLVFSPYLIHGGSTNFNPDTTRISIEIRLWKK